MTDPLGLDGVEQLAVVERSGLIESRHLGAAAVVDADGALLRTVGDVRALVYPRSTLKPMQAIAVLRAGVDLDGEQLALAAASHGATLEHLRVVYTLLARGGLDEFALQCPPDLPLDRVSREEVVLRGLTPSPVYMNCSGKHAAFLLACKDNGWPIESYLEPGHPLQQLVRSVVEEYTGEPVEHTGVDGCGAPVLAVTLAGLARATSRIAAGTDPESARLTAAILANGWAIEAPGRPNTTVIDELGILAKGGAEGVMVMGTPSGAAVALKVIDGSPRASTLVALELLASVGAVDAERARAVAASVTERVLGGGREVGTIRATL